MAYSHFFNVLRYDTATDISADLRLDSPAAVQAAVSFAFNACFAKFPHEAWAFRMNYSRVGGAPIAHMRLEDHASSIFGEVGVSFRTGELLAGDVSEKCRV